MAMPETVQCPKCKADRMRKHELECAYWCPLCGNEVAYKAVFAAAQAREPQPQLETVTFYTVTGPVVLHVDPSVPAGEIQERLDRESVMPEWFRLAVVERAPREVWDAARRASASFCPSCEQALNCRCEGAPC